MGLWNKKISSAIVQIIILTIASNVLLRLILGWLRKKREIAQVRLELNFEKKLSIHEMKLSLIDLESTKVQSIRRNIEQAKMRTGGIERVIHNFDIIVKNISSLIVAGIVFVGMFFVTLSLPIIILGIILIICTVITLQLQAKQNILVSELNDQANQANGSAFSYIQFISNYQNDNWK